MMPIGEICNREVVVATRDMTVELAAQLMRRHHVGAILWSWMTSMASEFR